MSVIDFELKVEGENGRIGDSDDLTEKGKERVEERIEAERGRLRSRISVDGVRNEAEISR